MSTVRKVPLRKCIGCNEMKNKKEMIRVVKTTEGTIVPDTTGRMNGRGAYVCSLECLGKAMKNKGLSRSLKAEIPSEVILMKRFVWKMLPLILTAAPLSLPKNSNPN